MKYNKKIGINFSKLDEHTLDGQSKICNWLYNHLLDICKRGYFENNNSLNLMKDRNLRDQVPLLKEAYSFLNSVHSSPLKNTALRLREAFDRYFDGNCEYPKFRSYKKKWFSLYFDEPKKGFKLLDQRIIRITLGKGCDNKQMHVIGTLKENLKLSKNEKIKTFRLCKQQGGKFYGIFTIEAEEPKAAPIKTWIAIDQNHKNFFIAVDNKGRTFEFLRLFQDKYFDSVIDELKSKRDLCLRKHKEKTTFLSKTKYYVPNRRYVKLEDALNRTYSRKREQIKQIMYSIAHFIAENYDMVVIGDYVPSKDTAKYDSMHRSMLNESHIGEFRKILKWVMTKSKKSFVLVSEKDTTKKCCVCGYEEKKEPNIREFVCPKCKIFILRDVNSAVNIAEKAGLVPENLVLDKINKVGLFVFKKQKLMVI